MQAVLEAKHVKIQFRTKKGTVTAVDDVNFSVGKGEILGIVGESGCGKSVTSLAAMRLLPQEGRLAEGELILEGKNIYDYTEDEMCGIRGNRISMVFQDPLTSLNPVMTIGKQLMECFVIHQKLNKKEAYERSVEMLRKVGIPSPEQRMKVYPHQLSGGMRQRVMIAMALSCKPNMLIADEPTTALDVTMQAQILQLMTELRDQMGTAIVIITHDMGVVAEMADYIMVMYAGQSVEYRRAEDLFTSPLHPYTQGLLNAIPRLDKDVEMLYSIPGTVPDLSDMPAGCRFAPRCPYATDICRNTAPKETPVEGYGWVRCWRTGKEGEDQNG